MIWWLSCLLLKCVQTCCLNNPSPHKQSFIHKKGAFLVKWHNSGLCVAKGNWATVNSWSRRHFWRWYEQVCLWDSVGITFTTDSQRRKDHCWVWRCQCHVTYVVWRSTCDNTFVGKVFFSKVFVMFLKFSLAAGSKSGPLHTSCVQIFYLADKLGGELLRSMICFCT